MAVDVSCPHCGTLFTVRRELLGKQAKCTSCGKGFLLAEPAADSGAEGPPALEDIPEVFPSVATEAPSPPPPPPTPEPPRTPQGSGRWHWLRELFGIEADVSQPRFVALRMVARAYEIMAWLMLVGAAIILLIALFGIATNPRYVIQTVVASGLTFLWTTMVAVSLLFIAQVIRLGLQIERNTRETRQACRELANRQARERDG